jgi:hypothetical protein
MDMSCASIRYVEKYVWNAMVSRYVLINYVKVVVPNAKAQRSVFMVIVNTFV